MRNVYFWRDGKSQEKYVFAQLVSATGTAIPHQAIRETENGQKLQKKKQKI